MRITCVIPTGCRTFLAIDKYPRGAILPSSPYEPDKDGDFHGTVKRVFSNVSDPVYLMQLVHPDGQVLFFLCLTKYDANCVRASRNDLLKSKFAASYRLLFDFLGREYPEL